MQWWLKWFVIASLATWLGYYRYWTSELVRTRTTGLSRITSSLANNTDAIQFFNQSKQINSSRWEFEYIIYADGLCGNLELPPMERYCTPPVHIHPNQTELFTVLQGQLGYRLGDKIYSCDIHTCPRPIIVSPLVPHTLWMHDNKEDLIVHVVVEPLNQYGGVRKEFFENFFGVRRDDHAPIWQIFVIFENADTYLASMPLPLSKIIVKLGALIGRLLGYKIEYEEYTTISNELD